MSSSLNLELYFLRPGLREGPCDRFRHQSICVRIYCRLCRRQHTSNVTLQESGCKKEEKWCHDVCWHADIYGSPVWRSLRLTYCFSAVIGRQIRACSSTQTTYSRTFFTAAILTWNRRFNWWNELASQGLCSEPTCKTAAPWFCLTRMERTLN